MTGASFCAVVPTYNNPQTVGKVVRRLTELGLDVIVIDDGSAPQGRAATDELCSLPGVHVRHRDENGGKGAAVQDGFDWARELGFTHALQIDADGQHALDDVPSFVAASQKEPEALVMGYPVFDASAPRGRVIGRKISVFWCAVETLGRKIKDPLCGFRVYPLKACARLARVSDGMEFDSEIAVRLVWNGTPTINLPTRVIYLQASDGGVSHFHMVRDNLRISWMHTRLVTWGILLLLSWPLRRLIAPRGTGRLE